MKLLTHNFLSSSFLKNVKIGYPLALKVTKVEEAEVNYNPDFVKAMMPKIEYAVLVEAAKASSINLDNIPESIPDKWEDNEDFMKKVHRLINCVNVIEGELQCPESGRIFTIRDGIPNMLANEDEVDEP